jgi:hypothetical protein
MHSVLPYSASRLCRTNRRSSVTASGLADRVSRQLVTAYAGELLVKKVGGTSELPIHRKFRAKEVVAIV